MSSSRTDKSSMSIDDIYAQMDRDGKAAETIPMSVFLPTALVGIPVWLFGILPLTVTYQLGKAILQSLLPKSKEQIAGEEAVDKTLPSDVTPRKNRKYDVVVLGATGFTGKLAATHIAKTYGVDGKKVKWAIAGRNPSKLEQVKHDIGNELNMSDMDKLDTFVVDTSDLSTLPTLVKDAKCVITTAGPFQKYGSNVVEYCAKYGTHYVDITGEVEWVKTMIQKWDDVAKQTGAILCPLCGHDSVPWDLTVYKLTQMYGKTEEKLESVTCLDEVVGSVSGGTLDTIFMSLDGKDVKAAKSDIDPLLKLPDGSKSTNRTKLASPYLSIEKCNSDAPGRYKSGWTMPFLMAEVNGLVVKRSNALSQDGVPSLTYKEVAVMPDFKTAFVSMFGMIAGVTALLNPITGIPVKAMLPKPGEGPSASQMKRNYLCITGQGLGSKGSRAETAIYFSKDVGYTETGRMVAESGLCLALDQEKLPVKKGGFWTPATAMGDALLDRLCKTGTMFASRMKSKL